MNSRWCILAALCGSLLTACNGPFASEEKPPAEGAEKEGTHAAVSVPTEVVRYTELRKQLTLSGVVSALPDHSVKVSPAIAGKLTQVLVVAGQRVKAGEAIARLDSRHIQEQLEQANAAVQTAKLAVEQAKGNVAFAKENLDRTQKLFSAEVSAKKDVIAAQNALQVAQSAVLTAQTQVQSTEANRKQFETELSFTEIHSPLAGVVASRFLNTGDTTDPNVPIAQIVALDTVLVNAALPADSPERIHTGERAAVSSVATGTESFPATVVSISPVVDAQTNTVRVQLRCPNPGYKLLEGQSVSVSITTGVTHAALLVPRSAVVPDPEDPSKTMVYVVHDGKAKRVAITCGASEGDHTEILSGLSSGQTIVASGAYGLPDGSEIKLQQARR